MRWLVYPSVLGAGWYGVLLSGLVCGRVGSAVLALGPGASYGFCDVGTDIWESQLVGCWYESG